MESIRDISLGFKWFHANVKTNVIFSRQKGSYRISCLDCLTRTNRFLSILGLQNIMIILKKFNLFRENFTKLSL